MGVIRKLESWSSEEAPLFLVFNFMLIMSRTIGAFRLIRPKFYGTLADRAGERSQHVVSKSSPNQQPKVVLKEPENPHIVNDRS